MRSFHSVLLLIISLICFSSGKSSAQKKIIILGSSTAEGQLGVSSYSNSWVGKYTAYAQSVNSLNTVINLAVSGFGTYSVVPTWYSDGYLVQPDTTKNITKALSLQPDIIIVNLPTNDATTYTTVTPTMARFRLLKRMCDSAGVKFWITTTQPRNTGRLAQDLILYTRDSIIQQFPNQYIEFFEGLGVLGFGGGSILAQFNSGDGVHLNDSGHEILFQRAKNQPILVNTILPIYNFDFKALKTNQEVQLSWRAENRGVLKCDVEKSADGFNFSQTASLHPTADGYYKAVDNAPFPGTTFYRIKVIYPSSFRFSDVISVSLLSRKENVFIFPNPIQNNKLNFQFSYPKVGRFTLTLMDVAGNEIYRDEFDYPGGSISQTFRLQPSYKKGIYLLRISNKEAFFTKLIIAE